MFLSKSKFLEVVRNAPLISIDLCILKDREILLGKRTNPPAKNFFFVPGGRIYKSESMKNALDRILMDELAIYIKNKKQIFIKELGIYEHFYDDNFLNNKEFATHYIVIAYLIPYEILCKTRKNIISSQHSEFIWTSIDNVKLNSYKIHKYTLEYFKDILLQKI